MAKKSEAQPASSASLAGVSNSRVVVENLRPAVDGGRFPAKRTRGEEFTVTAHVMTDGHDAVGALLKVRPCGSGQWQEYPMRMVNPGLSLWGGSLRFQDLGEYEFTVEGWMDPFASWRHEISKKSEARQDLKNELLEGAGWVRDAAARAQAADRTWLENAAARLEAPENRALAVETALSAELAAVMARYPDRSRSIEHERAFRVLVEDPRARVGAWYEFFPRSASGDPRRHGTFSDAARRLPDIAAMGFDVVYLPPIHPIGKSFRKGPNNSLKAGPTDPGSPWAIGSAEGGHKSVHPELGTLADFDAFVTAARKQNLEVALDIAFQCSPDHPYVREHPEWFKHRPDGTIKYAENPPKKYQDIYPLDFECADWPALWEELKSVVLFWADHGVRIFRVDNPHTKPFRFWEWLIREVRAVRPDSVFLAEAFTRPPVMQHLAKIGFSQSYTYFTWRNTKPELTEYFTELTQTDVREYMRPNLFANTPDILHEYLQFGGRPAFLIRLVLAATLGASYGIYGPAFEVCDGAAVPGTEEYQDSEKYQLRAWNTTGPGPIREWVARINRIRRAHPALQEDSRLRFYPVDNDRMIFYGKATADFSDILLVVVNLDPRNAQAGWVQVPLAELGLGAESYQVHDLMSDARYLWTGSRNFVRLDPHACPAHVLHVRRKVKTEKDFDYFA